MMDRQLRSARFLARVRTSSTIAVFVLGGIAACADTKGYLSDDCSTDDDCADSYSCVKCSSKNTCYFQSQLNGPDDYEWACEQWGSGTPTDSRYSGSSGSSSSGGGGDCSKAWTCTNDGQATPMCKAACNYSGSQRTQTCEVLASMLESGNAGECCAVCK